jgi:hypothetical protein
MAQVGSLGRSCLAAGPLGEFCWTDLSPARIPGENRFPAALVTLDRVVTLM